MVTRLQCLISGHDSLLHRSEDRMYLECIRCGWESPGWELNVKESLESREQPRRQPVPHRLIVAVE
jgi:hypothetical protein